MDVYTRTDAEGNRGLNKFALVEENQPVGEVGNYCTLEETTLSTMKMDGGVGSNMDVG